MTDFYCICTASKKRYKTRWQHIGHSHSTQELQKDCGRKLSDLHALPKQSRQLNKKLQVNGDPYESAIRHNYSIWEHATTPNSKTISFLFWSHLKSPFPQAQKARKTQNFNNKSTQSIMKLHSREWTISLVWVYKPVLGSTSSITDGHPKQMSHNSLMHSQATSFENFKLRWPRQFNEAKIH